MATKNDFSTNEWEILRNAPHLVVLAVAAAGASGLIGSIAEAVAPSGAFVEALKGSNRLLHDVCEKDQIKASIEAIKTMAHSIEDFSTIQSMIRRAAIDQSRAAIDLLKQKSSHEDVVAYRDFILKIGNKVANAAKEGAFLGFGGERVSEPERTLLAELAEAVGAGILQA